MKMKKVTCYILMLLPLAITLTALPFLPSQIPAHYGIDNQVTRWGSKYETLILPVTIIIFGLFMLAITNYTAKREKEGENNEKVCVLTTIVLLIIFNIMTLFFLYTDFNKVEDLSMISPDIDRLILGILGIFMIVIGNVMPKLRMNSLIGLRTKWSMKNEAVWKKSQFCGGVSFIVGGVIIILICLLAKNSNYFMWVMGIFIVLIAVDVFLTYKIAQGYL